MPAHTISGILIDKTMAVKLMYITNDDTLNYPLSTLQLMVAQLDTQLNKPTNQNSLKVPKVIKPTNKKKLL